MRARALCGSDGVEQLPLDALRGERVTVIAGIGDPRSFVAQMAAAGAVADEQLFPDHHAYGSARR